MTYSILSVVIVLTANFRLGKILVWDHIILLIGLYYPLVRQILFSFSMIGLVVLSITRRNGADYLFAYFAAILFGFTLPHWILQQYLFSNLFMTSCLIAIAVIHLTKKNIDIKTAYEPFIGDKLSHFVCYVVWNAFGGIVREEYDNLFIVFDFFFFPAWFVFRTCLNIEIAFSEARAVPAGMKDGYWQTPTLYITKTSPNALAPPALVDISSRYMGVSGFVPTAQVFGQVTTEEAFTFTALLSFFGTFVICSFTTMATGIISFPFVAICILYSIQSPYMNVVTDYCRLFFCYITILGIKTRIYRGDSKAKDLLENIETLKHKLPLPLPDMIVAVLSTLYQLTSKIPVSNKVAAIASFLANFKIFGKALDKIIDLYKNDISPLVESLPKQGEDQEEEVPLLRKRKVDTNLESDDDVVQPQNEDEMTKKDVTEELIPNAFKSTVRSIQILTGSKKLTRSEIGIEKKNLDLIRSSYGVVKDSWSAINFCVTLLQMAFLKAFELSQGKPFVAGPNQALVDRAAQWVEECGTLAEEIPELKAAYDRVLAYQVLEHTRVGHDLAKELMRAGFRANNFNYFFSHLSRMETTAMKCRALLKRGGSRCVPLCVHLLGDPGNGKSVLSCYIAKIIAHLEGRNFTTNDVYYKPIDTTTWDGYYHQYVVCDDFFQIADDQIRAQMAGIWVAAVNDVPYHLPMADLPLKAITYFMSDLFVITGNQKRLPKLPVQDMGAIRRRRHLVYIVDFDHSAYEQASLDPNFDPDLFHSEFYRFQKVDPLTQQVKGSVTVNEFTEQIAQKYLALKKKGSMYENITKQNFDPQTEDILNRYVGRIKEAQETRDQRFEAYNKGIKGQTEDEETIPFCKDDYFDSVGCDPINVYSDAECIDNQNKMFTTLWLLGIFLFSFFVLYKVYRWYIGTKVEAQSVGSQNPGHKQKPTTRVEARSDWSSPVAQNEHDENSMNLVEVFSKNMCYVSLRKVQSEPGIKGHCVFIKERKFLMVGHSQFMLDKKTSGMWFTAQHRWISRSQIKFIVDNSNDLMFGEILDKSFPMFPDITHHFILPREIDSDYLHTIIRISKKNNILRTDSCRGFKMNVEMEYDSIVGNVAYGCQVHRDRCLTFNMDNAPGFCLSLYMVENPKMQHKLFGGHTAGSKQACVSYAVMLDQDYLTLGFSKLDNIIEGQTQNELPQFCYEDFPSWKKDEIELYKKNIDWCKPWSFYEFEDVLFDRYGMVIQDLVHDVIGLTPRDKASVLPKKNDIIEGPAHNLFGSCGYAPAMLRSEFKADPKGGHGFVVDPVENMLRKFNTQSFCQELDPDLCEEVTDYMVWRIPNVVGNQNCTLDEAINGSSRWLYLKSIEMHTGSGYRHVVGCRDKIAKEKGKNHLFNEEKPFAKPNEEFMKISDAFDRKWSLELPSEDAIHVSKFDEKVELRPIEKVETGATRGIQPCEAVFCVKMRQALAPLIESSMASRIDNGCAVGINPHSDEWKKLFDRMRSYGSGLALLDCKSFDYTIPFPVQKWVRIFMLKWYKIRRNASGQTLRYLKNMISELETGFVIFVQIIFYVWHTNRTGQPITAFYNSWCLMFMTIYGIIHYFRTMAGSKLLTDFPVNTYLYSKYIGDQLFGDDSMLSWADKLKPFLNLPILGTIYEMFGLTVTDFKKRPLNTIEFHTWQEAEFLKRGFVPSGTLVLAPMDKKRIDATLYYVKSGLDKFEQTRERMDTCLREAFHYGPEHFEARKMIYNVWLEAHELKPLLMTWQSCYLDYTNNLLMEEGKPSVTGQMEPEEIEDAADELNRQNWLTGLKWWLGARSITIPMEFLASFTDYSREYIRNEMMTRRHDHIDKMQQKLNKAYNEVRRIEDEKRFVKFVKSHKKMLEKLSSLNEKDKKEIYRAVFKECQIDMKDHEAVNFAMAAVDRLITISNEESKSDPPLGQMEDEEKIERKANKMWGNTFRKFNKVMFFVDVAFTTIRTAVSIGSAAAMYQESKVQEDHFNEVEKRVDQSYEDLKNQRGHDLDNEEFEDVKRFLQHEMEMRKKKDDTRGQMDQETLIEDKKETFEDRVALTSFEDHEGEQSDPSTSTYAIFHQGMNPHQDQQLGTILSRVYRDTFEWSNAESFGNVVFDNKYPARQFAAMPSLRTRIQMFGAFASGMKFKVKVNATPMFIGSLLISVMPHWNDDLIVAHEDNIYAWSQWRSFVLAASDESPIEFEVPWSGPRNWMLLDDTFESPGAQICHLKISVLNPLVVTNTDVTPPVEVTVFSSFVNPRVSMLTNDTFGQMEKEEAEESKNDGVISKPLSKVSEKLAHFAIVPGAGPYFSLASTIAKLGSQIARLFGRDFPTDEKQPAKLITNSLQNLSFASGMDDSFKLAMSPANSVSTSRSIYHIDKIDYSEISNFASIPTLVAHGSYTPTDATEDVIFNHWVTPLECKRTFISGRYNLETTYAAAVASQFAFMRPVMGYILYLECSAFVSSRISINHHFAVSSTVATEGPEIGNLASAVIDVKGGKHWFYFELPYNRDTPWLICLPYTPGFDAAGEMYRRTNGLLTISVTNKLAYSGTTTNALTYFNVWSCARPQSQWACPRSTTEIRPFGWTENRPKGQMEQERCIDFRDTGRSIFDPLIPASHVVYSDMQHGETITSLISLMKRPNQIGGFNNSVVPSVYVEMPDTEDWRYSSNSNLYADNPQRSNIFLRGCFHFFRGSYRVKFVAKHTSNANEKPYTTISLATFNAGTRTDLLDDFGATARCVMNHVDRTAISAEIPFYSQYNYNCDHQFHDETNNVMGHVVRIESVNVEVAQYYAFKSFGDDYSVGCPRPPPRISIPGPSELPQPVTYQGRHYYPNHPKYNQIKTKIEPIRIRSDYNQKPK